MLKLIILVVKANPKGKPTHNLISVHVDKQEADATQKEVIRNLDLSGITYESWQEIKEIEGLEPENITVLQGE